MVWGCPSRGHVPVAHSVTTTTQGSRGRSGGECPWPSGGHGGGGGGDGRVRADPHTRVVAKSPQ